MLALSARSHSSESIKPSLQAKPTIIWFPATSAVETLRRLRRQKWDDTHYDLSDRGSTGHGGDVCVQSPEENSTADQNSSMSFF
jgi:hypothetical protein